VNPWSTWVRFHPVTGKIVGVWYQTWACPEHLPGYVLFDDDEVLGDGDDFPVFRVFTRRPPKGERT